MSIKNSSILNVALVFCGSFLLVPFLVSLFFLTLQDHGVLKGPESTIWSILSRAFELMETRWFDTWVGFSFGLVAGLWIGSIVKQDEHKTPMAQVVQTKNSLEPKKSSFNWLPWQGLQEVTVEEFAKILSQEDPVAMQKSSQASGYQKRILEAVKAKEIPYVQQYYKDSYSRDIPADIDYETPISLPDALRWAESLGFPVSHMRPTKPK